MAVSNAGNENSELAWTGQVRFSPCAGQKITTPTAVISAIRRLPGRVALRIQPIHRTEMPASSAASKTITSTPVDANHA